MILAETHKEEGTARPGHMHLVISLLKRGFITLALSSFVSCLLPLSLFPGLAVGWPVIWKGSFFKEKYRVTITNDAIYTVSLLCEVLCRVSSVHHLESLQLSTVVFINIIVQKRKLRITCPKSYHSTDETGVLKLNLPMLNMVFLPSLSIADKKNVFPSN